MFGGGGFIGIDMCGDIDVVIMFERDGLGYDVFLVVLMVSLWLE